MELFRVLIAYKTGKKVPGRNNMISVGVSGQRGYPDTWSLTRRFSMKQKPI